MNDTKIQENSNNKKIELKSKIYFRILEVFYWLALLASILFALFVASIMWVEWGYSSLLWGTIIIFVFFTGLKKIGYYILIGNMKK